MNINHYNSDNNQSYFKHLLIVWSSLNKSGRAYYLSLLACLAPFPFAYLKAVLVRLNIGGFTETIFGLICLVFAIPYLKGKVKSIDVLVYVLLSLMLYLSPVLWSQTADFVLEYGSMLVFTIAPFFFLGIALNYERDHDILLSISRIAIIAELLMQVFYVLGITNREQSWDGTMGEQMVAAFQLILPLMFMTFHCINDNNIFDKFLTLLGVVLLFFLGTRGPLVVFGVFVIGNFVLIQKYRKRAFLKKAVILVLMISFFVFLEPILFIMLPIAQSLGFSVRIFDKMLEGNMVNIEDSSGRDAIWMQMENAISSNPGGYGFGGDRYLISPGKLYFNAYAHNVELELLIHFGLLIGGVILLFLLLLFVRSYLSVRKTQAASFWFVLFCSGFVTLQTSGSYIDQVTFFVLLGYCVSVIRSSKLSTNILTKLNKYKL